MNKRPPFFSRLFGVLLMMTLLHGCALTGSTDPKSKDDAEVLYNDAMEDLHDGLFPEAIKGFSSVRTKHPYSNFARLAMLRIADANRERGQYEQAVALFRRAADSGSADAQKALGKAYFDGEGVPEDKEEALQLIKARWPLDRMRKG